jgi:hypothetical protein
MGTPMTSAQTKKFKAQRLELAQKMANSTKYIVSQMQPPEPAPEPEPPTEPDDGNESGVTLPAGRNF